MKYIDIPKILWDYKKLELVEHVDVEFIDKFNQIKNETVIRLTRGEYYNLYWFLKQRWSMKGAICEVGVQSGGSALMLAETKQYKDRLILCDKWGIIEDYVDETDHNPIDYDIPMYLIEELFNKYPNVYILKGLFPQETGIAIKQNKFKFVHIDVNLRKSVKDCLEFFYPRLVKGGILISHDYKVKRGIETGAYIEVNKFCSKNKIMPIRLRGNHVAIIK